LEFYLFVKYQNFFDRNEIKGKSEKKKEKKTNKRKREIEKKRYAKALPILFVFILLLNSKDLFLNAWNQVEA